MKNRRYLSIILIAVLCITNAYSQENAALLKKAEQLHKDYQFSGAMKIYNSILQQRPDATLTTEKDSLYNMEIMSRLITSENGKNMLMFASTPVAVAKQVFPSENFFLNIPGFGKGSWVVTPAELAPEAAGNPFNAMQYPKGCNAIVYSAPDKSGSWNIMYSRKLNDTLWSAPQILNENITTQGNEILPHLSADGKTLYFASNGHYGMGGYDLYMSQWNSETGDWDVAQNLGFPYSSTANDYLYCNTADGEFTVVVSDRETGSNQVTAYASIYEATPLKNEVLQEEALKLSHMVPNQKSKEGDNGSGSAEDNGIRQDAQFAAYTEAVNKVRGLQENLKKSIAQLDRTRDEYANTADSLKKVDLEKKMLNQEADILALSQHTTTAVSQLQQIELDYLAKGIIISSGFEEQNTAPAAPKEKAKFAFAGNSMGKTPSFNFEKVEPKADMEFKILPQAVIADLSVIPDGLVYHIQLMTTNSKASLKALKGFSPVFERKLASGKYTYSAGLFYTYAEALKNLNTVKKKGFPTALITAYNNGKSVSTKNAKLIEQKNSNVYRVTIAGYDTLPAEALAIIRENTTRDIAKANVGGVMKYIIGPFDNKAKAEALANALSAAHITSVEIEKAE